MVAVRGGPRSPDHLLGQISCQLCRRFSGVVNVLLDVRCFVYRRQVTAYIGLASFRLEESREPGRVGKFVRGSGDFRRDGQSLFRGRFVPFGYEGRPGEGGRSLGVFGLDRGLIFDP